MVNEAHDRDLRCARTREIGRRRLAVAHRLGVRHLAMEALAGTAGLLAEEAMRIPEMAETVAQADAFAFSLHNDLE